MKALLRHPLGLTGALLTGLMFLLCFGAPLFTSFDPEDQQLWVGAQPVGTHTALLLAHQKLQMGQRAVVHPQMMSSPSIAFQVEPQNYHEVRVAWHRGRVHRLYRVEGAVPLQSFEQKEREVSRRFRDGHLKSLQNLNVELGHPPPHDLSDGSERGVAFLRIHGPRRPAQRVEAALDAQGRVTSLRIDGQSSEAWEARADDIVATFKADAPATQWHLLGTDDLGRDLFSRILYGGQVSLLVGLVATLVSLLIGVSVGSIAGYFGGRTDRWIMAGVDTLYAIPFMFLVILLLVLFGRSLLLLFVALGCVQWLTMSRIVRSQVQSLCRLPYVDAARLAGAPIHAQLWRYILPGCSGPIIVYTTLTVPAVILEESFLSFIGLTVQYGGRSLDSWGSLVHQGMLSLGGQGENVGLLFFPALFMGLTLLGLNLLGDAIQDITDPKRRVRRG